MVEFAAILISGFGGLRGSFLQGRETQSGMGSQSQAYPQAGPDHILALPLTAGLEKSGPLSCHLLK